jgi:hypothetical protein
MKVLLDVITKLVTQGQDTFPPQECKVNSHKKDYTAEHAF